MSTHLAKPEHQVVYQELVKLMKKHTSKLNSEEVLAVAANMVGKIIAMQDRRITSPERAIEIVIENLQIGNVELIKLLRESKGSA
jgi:hypothetical protein